MYIPVACVGNILAYALDMRRTQANLLFDLERLRDEMDSQTAADGRSPTP